MRVSASPSKALHATYKNYSGGRKYLEKYEDIAPGPVKLLSHLEEHLLDQDQRSRKHQNVSFAFDQCPLSLPPVTPRLCLVPLTMSRRGRKLEFPDAGFVQ